MTKILENCKVIFHRFLFHMYIKTYERKLFHHQEILCRKSSAFIACNLDVYFSRKCKIKIIQRSVTAATLGSSLAADDVLSYSHVVFIIQCTNLLANAV